MMSPRVETSNEVLEDFKKNLPFNLTNSQDSVIDEINENLNQTKPMRRLVQGDVGSGKTVVAAAAMLSVAKNNFQTVLLCPTEVLAEQHFKNFSLWMKNETIDIALLTGKTKKNEWEKINKGLVSGKTKILIGTHSVFQKRVSIKNLALVVLSEA